MTPMDCTFQQEKYICTKFDSFFFREQGREMRRNFCTQRKDVFRIDTTFHYLDIVHKKSFRFKLQDMSLNVKNTAARGFTIMVAFVKAQKIEGNA